MAYNTFAPIVRTNLFLCLDSVNTKSYPGSGISFYDLTLNGNNFNFATTPPTFNGVLGFDGVTDYGTMSYNSNYNLSITDFTMEGFFSSNDFSNAQCLIAKDTSGINFDWALYMFNSTTLIFYSNGTATNVTATVPTMLINQWYHYVVTSISGNIRIYLNGVLYAGPTAMSVSNSSQVAVTVGCYSWNNPGGLFNGKISTIRIYKTGLTGEQILQNYNTLKNRFI